MGIPERVREREKEREREDPMIVEKCVVGLAKTM